MRLSTFIFVKKSMNSLTSLIETSNTQKTRVLTLRNAEEKLLHLKPDIKAWSVLQVIEHLNLTFDLYLPNIEKSIAQCSEIGDPVDHYKKSFAGKLMINGSRPNHGKRKWKMKTFKFFTPDQELNLDVVFDNWLDNQSRFTELIKQARLKDLTKSKVVSAAGPIITFKLGECFEFILAHQERHLLQAEETKQKVININIMA